MKISSQKVKQNLSYGRGQCVFYRPVCKVPNNHVTDFFWSIWVIGAIFSQIYWANHHPNPSFRLQTPYLNVLVCKIPTRQVVDPNFCKQSCIIVFYLWSKFQVPSICSFWDLKGGPRGPPKMLRLAKKRKTHEGLRQSFKLYQLVFDEVDGFCVLLNLLQCTFWQSLLITIIHTRSFFQIVTCVISLISQ